MNADQGFPVNVPVKCGTQWHPNGRMVGSSFRRNTRWNLHALLKPNRREPFDIRCCLRAFLLSVRRSEITVS